MKKMPIKDSNHCKKKFSIFLFLVCFLLPLSATTTDSKDTKAEPTDVFELIMQRIQTRHKAVNVSTVDNTYTKWYMQDLQADGSFANIDYTSTAQTNWNPLAHLDRLKYMVLSYTLPASNFYQNETLYNQIVLMLNFWYDKNPKSTNWFNQQIACPQRMGVILILMRSGAKQLPADLEAKLIKRMETDGGRPDQSGSQGTGANKLDIATHWVYRGCLIKNESVLSFGAEQVYYPLFLTTAEGLQHDFSYHQHGNQIYMGSYGFSFVDGISSIADYMTGTPYEMSKEKLNYLSRFTREGYVATIRGQYFMFNVLGRAVSRQGALSQSGFGTVLNRLKNMDPDNATEYDQTTERLKANQSASYAIKPYNKSFWRSDYVLHQRPAYAFDVRGASTYSAKNENGNGENLKAYFMADGATELVLDGTEYVNIFGVWDWNRIPGTTTPIVSSIPQPAQWQTLGSSKFSGTASDGVYGVTTYQYNDPLYSLNTSAKKAWFMFDDEIVCLGAAITSTTQTVNTTVNQTLLSGDVWVKKDGSTSQKLAKGTSNQNNLLWAHHRNIGYYFPEKGNLNISNTAQSGNWYTINTTQTNATESKDVFKLWFDHGQKPSNQSYQYFLLPNKSVSQMEAYTPQNIEVIYNNATLQAVRNKSLDILSIVFYSATTFKHEDIEISVNKPCVVMFRNVSTPSVSTYISDPSRNNTAIKVVAKFPAISETKELNCTLTKLKDPYAGSTVSYTIDANTPIVEPEAQYDSIVVSDDAWVRDGTDANNNVGGTSNTLTIKKDNAGYNREVYLKIDLSSINTSAYQKYLLQLSVSNANTSIAETEWNVSYISDDNWKESTITWNNSPAKDYLIKSVSTVSSGAKFVVDLTDVVLNEIKNGNKLLSLHLASTQRGSDGKTDAQFFSKESSIAENHPQLLLQLNDEVAPAEVVEVETVADAYVRDGATLQNNNYGKENTIVIKKDGVGYDRQGYLKFNLDAIKGRKIRSVSLKLYVNNANTSVSEVQWALSGTATNWEEGTITYANRPQETANELVSIQGADAKNFVTFDISDYVKNQFNEGAKDISLRLYGLNKASDGKHDAQFASRENSVSANHPRLVIELEPEARIVCVSSLSTEITTPKKEETFTVSGVLKNEGGISFSGNLAVGLVNSDEQIVAVIGEFATNTSLPSGQAWAEPVDAKCNVSGDVPAGNYSIRAIAKSLGNDSWNLVYGEPGVKDSLPVTVTDSYPIETAWRSDNYNRNWNLPQNWTNGVPGATSKVIIPKNDISSSPLIPDSTVIGTIYFQAGAQISGQQSLIYDKAFVDYNFDASTRGEHFQTYAFPLQEGYPSDFTFGGQPKTYLQTLEVDDLGRGKWVTASGGNSSKFTAGSGFILSIDENKDADKGLALSGDTLRLPFFDADAGVNPLVHPNHTYNVMTGMSVFYNPNDSTQSYTVVRTPYAYRLAGSEVTIDPKFGKSGNQYFALIGNPFMCNILFTELYRNGNNSIKENYQIWTKVGDQEGYAGFSPEGYWGLITSAGLTSSIPPLQGFIVERIGTESNPITFIYEELAENYLSRSATRSVETGNKINIIAKNEVASVGTFIAKRSSGSNLLGDKDARKLMNEFTAVPEVYTIKASENGEVSVGANVIESDNVEYPVGIATAYNGKITLTFSGMDTYNARVIFIDKVLGKTVELTGLNAYDYSFDYVAPKSGETVVATNDRFSLRIASETSSSLEEFGKSQALVVYSSNGFIHASTNYASTIKEMAVYSLSGMLMYQQSVNDTSSVTNTSFAPGAYIVKVKTDNGVEHRKLIVK